jgi:hypothetical protein
MSYDQLTIEKAKNGFIVSPPSDRFGMTPATGSSLYVFPDFASLCQWLDANLSKPAPENPAA